MKIATRTSASLKNPSFRKLRFLNAYPIAIPRRGPGPATTALADAIRVWGTRWVASVSLNFGFRRLTKS